MWAFTRLPANGAGFKEWIAGEPRLVDAGLGYELPPEFAAHLSAAGVPGSEFHAALMHATEVLYGSLYGAADSEGSYWDVMKLSSIALAAGAMWPDFAAFAEDRWRDDGWGSPISPEKLARWRSAGTG